ncbi:hypothetical protein GCM10023093_12010 [Nemorincola caseinilytica]|uniref:Lipoprotein n=2 Tax=Nemorincola caseinilytica TaxID=2054315 RepID=A0ABP8NB30_9BACT
MGLLLSSGMFLGACKERTSSDPVYPDNCGNFLVGTYAGSDYCASTGQTHYSCNILATTPTNITLSNLGGIQVNAIVDCEKNTLTIPTQTVGNFSVSGSGTYTANRIVINWSGITAGMPINCSTTFTR